MDQVLSARRRQPERSGRSAGWAGGSSLRWYARCCDSRNRTRGRRTRYDPGRLTTRVVDHAGSAGRWSARAERMKISCRACSGSSRCSRRACRSSGGTGPGLPCRVGTRRAEHLARAVAVHHRHHRRRHSRRPNSRRRRRAAERLVAAGAFVAGGLAAGPARGAAARLGEATLRVEVLLGCGENELLSTVRAGQGLVCVHERNSSR